jgi:uncharacterized protein DUF4388
MKAKCASEVRVSLQGSLDGFPLPDVLALLASTKKRGELRVAGHRGSGRVWLEDGAIVGVETGTARVPVEALFQLLRVDSGSFTFDPGAEVPEGKPAELEPLLAEAQMRLADWRVIEAVVPSLATRVELADELPSPKVTISAAQWRVLRTVAGGATVEDVAKELGADEFGACQAVKRLVDVGLVTVDQADRGTVTAPAPSSGEAAPEAGAEEHDVEERDAEPRRTPDPDELVSIPAHLRRARRVPVTVPEPAPKRSRLAEAAARRRQADAPAEPEASGDLVGAAAAALTPENADALVRELAELGTDVGQAAEVIEAASRAASTEERAAALEGVLANEEGEPLNRSMLLKFLSSVRS